MQYSLKYAKDNFFFIYGKMYVHFPKNHHVDWKPLLPMERLEGEKDILYRNISINSIYLTLWVCKHNKIKFPVINSSIPSAISRLKLDNE